MRHAEEGLTEERLMSSLDGAGEFEGDLCSSRFCVLSADVLSDMSFWTNDEGDNDDD